MPAFSMLHHLGQLLMRLWIGHVLSIKVLILIMCSESSFLYLRDILFYKLLNLSFSTLSDDCSPLVIHHFTPLYE